MDGRVHLFAKRFMLHRGTDIGNIAAAVVARDIGEVLLNLAQLRVDIRRQRVYVGRQRLDLSFLIGRGLHQFANVVGLGCDKLGQVFKLLVKVALLARDAALGIFETFFQSGEAVVLTLVVDGRLLGDRGG